MRSAVADVLAAVASALATVDARWYLFGAQAAIVHGVARVTADVDITVALGEASPTALVAALASEGFELRVSDPDEFLRRTRVLPLIHAKTGMPLDIVLAGPGPEEEFLRAAKVIDMEGVAVPVAIAEDILTMKILAGRPKDIEDATAIIAAQGKGLDLKRTRSMLRLLEQALDQSDLIPRLDGVLKRVRRGRRE